MSSEILEPALSQALKEDPEAYWAAVREVRLRDAEAVFAALEPLAESEDPLLRQLVPDVLRSRIERNLEDANRIIEAYGGERLDAGEIFDVPHAADAAVNILE